MCQAADAPAAAAACAGESVLCGVDAAGVINYADDSCSTCSGAVCPPPVNNATKPLPGPSPAPGSSPTPSSPSPSPEPVDPTVSKLSVRTGRTLTYLNGTSAVYNATIDARISTQYNDT